MSSHEIKIEQNTIAAVCTTHRGKKKKKPAYTGDDSNNICVRIITQGQWRKGTIKNKKKIILKNDNNIDNMFIVNRKNYNKIF